MKKIFLLIILIIGFEASTEIKGCLQGWTELTCRNHQYNRKPKIFISTTNLEQNSHIDICEERFHSSLFYYMGKKISLTFRQFEQQKPHIRETIEIKTDGCEWSAAQTDKTIRCDYPNQYQSMIKFICKTKDFVCEKLSPQSSQDSNGAFIIRVSSDNTVFYWCKMKKETPKNYAGLILKVADITTFTKSPTIGQKNFNYFCQYGEKVRYHDIFICKGEDPSKCEVVVRTENADKNFRFTMKNNGKNNVNITVREITASDSGTYWCGAENNEEQHSRIFMHRFFLNVVTTSTSPALSTASSSVFGTISMSPASLTATVSAIGGLGSRVKISIIIGAVGLTLLVLVIVTFALYKQCLHSEEAGDRSAEQHPKEDNIYEEIPDGLQTPVISIYATVNVPTNDPASLHYSTINFQTSSTKKADGKTLIMEPSSSSCQYTSLRHKRSPILLSDPPARSTGEPLYSAVKKSH